jgi:hypothetical protein
MVVSPYNQEQMEAINLVRKTFRECSPSEIESLKSCLGPYLDFRRQTKVFQDQYLAQICTRNCFTSWTSACCGREGIMTFFADVVINILLSSREEIERLVQTLLSDKGGTKCVYLSHEKGCLWQLKPIVCEMFLCDQAKEQVLKADHRLDRRWQELRQKEKDFTWPDKPVLFDELEEIFIQKGVDSPLMYFHKSPGLLRIKRS